jgi:prefoldin subunit 5
MEEIKELKVKAYDLISQLEFIQRELNAVNQKIAELTQKENEAGKSLSK